MPFAARGLQHIGAAVYRYRTDDDAAAVNAPGYWSPAWPTLRRGDAIFRVTLDASGQVTSAGRHVIIAAARGAVSSADGFGGGGIIAPPPTGQVTSISWRGEGLLIAAAGGLANNEISYRDGLYDFRADNDLLVTTADGAVSSLISGQSFAGTLTQATAANQPLHIAAVNALAFAAANETDLSAGDWLSLPQLATYIGTADVNRLGVAYFLFRRTGASHATTLFRVGANNGTYTRETARAYRIRIGASGNVQFSREGDTSGTYLEAATVSNLLADGTWYALAAVLNDDRDENGTPDQISRLFIKSLTDPNYTTMFAAQTAATTSVTNQAQIAEINRSRWNNNGNVAGIGTNLQVHSFGFDRLPPISNAGIENNLDKLLPRAT